MTAALEIRPIALPDLWSFLAAKKSPVPTANYRAIAREVVDGRVVGAFASGRVIALGAVSKVSQTSPPIAWLSTTSEGFGRFGLGAVKAIRAELRRAGAAIALIEEANANGQRLARLVGLEPTGDVKLGMRIWRGRDHGQDSKAAGRHGGGSTTPPG